MFGESMQQKWFCVCLIPDIADTNVDSTEITSNPTVNDPFSLPCFSDMENQLIPSDAADFVKITYRWEMKIGATLHDLGTVGPSRIQINPITGNSNHFVN